jgi:hypothetical protein
MLVPGNGVVPITTTCGSGPAAPEEFEFEVAALDCASAAPEKAASSPIAIHKLLLPCITHLISRVLFGFYNDWDPVFGTTWARYPNVLGKISRL